MLEGTPITEPISYGYLLLAAVLVLIACIAGITWIIRETYKNATSEPDYLGYWKKLHDLQKKPIIPFSQWLIEKELKGELKGLIDKQNTSAMLPATTYVAKPNPYNKKKVDVFLQTNWPVDITSYRPIVRTLDWNYYDLAPFDWGSFLESLINGGCTTQQIKRAKVLSAYFQTCPAGQVHPDIPREEDGEPGQPKDEQLCRLGAEFWRALNLDEYTRANDIYHQIKAREKQLLNQSGY